MLRQHNLVFVFVAERLVSLLPTQPSTGSGAVVYVTTLGAEKQLHSVGGRDLAIAANVRCLGEDADAQLALYFVPLFFCVVRPKSFFLL